ncbi:MAG: YbaB/EbfC family nucleoid-associated protein [Planctomycetota bacterium]|jgi:DNA-binding YbaB/EbfC family protein
MFGNLAKMMKLAGELKSKLPEMQAKLAQSEYTAEAGEGAVTATVNGKLALVDLKISGQIIADAQMDAEMLADLIKAAVSAAQHKAAEAGKQALMELTGGMEIPGLTDMI